MAAPKGNRFWEARSTHGRDKIFAAPSILLSAAVEYFEWVSDHPLEKEIVYQGEVSKSTESLMRAMTIKGLCIFLGVNSKYFNDFQSRLDLSTSEGKGFSDVVNTIKEIIETQKFEGASAGLLNPNIIARDLGLADVSKNEHTGKDGGPIETRQVDKLTDEELEQELEDLKNTK